MAVGEAASKVTMNVKRKLSLYDFSIIEATAPYVNIKVIKWLPQLP